jgi:predicted acyltransferase
MANVQKTPKPELSPRLMSLDALRGFDMFWIVGVDALVEGLRDLSNKNSFIAAIHNQLQHVQWEGFHFEDLIFPMFVFIAGVSLVFSLTRTIDENGKQGAVGRIVRRAVLLYLLGIFVYGGFSGSLHHIRLMGVLQRIALAYLFAGLIFVFFGLRGRIAWCLGLLVGYWALMAFVPVPGGEAGDFAEGKNLANWFDERFLPLWKWENKPYDPEGLLSTLPAIANCLIGVFAGMLLRNGRQKPWQKAALLAVSGVVLVHLGWLWAGWFWKYQIAVPSWLAFPVIKKIWTSSFVFVACGYSSLLLAAFYVTVDVIGWRRWAMPFVWIGVNPITIYLLAEMGAFETVANRLVGGELNKKLFDFGPLVLAVVTLLLVFAFAHFLYRRRVFIRL